jgi:predicted metal-dependent phosphoesterase TrpH
VTDHGTVEGLEAAIAVGKRLGVQVVTGCEITGELAGRVVHLLATGRGRSRPASTVWSPCAATDSSAISASANACGR